MIQKSKSLEKSKKQQRTKSSKDKAKQKQQKQKSTYKGIISKIPNPTGYLLIHIDEIQFAKKEKLENAEQLYLIIHVDQDKKQSQKIINKSSNGKLLVNQNFVFRCSAKSKVRLELYNPFVLKVLASFQFVITKLYHMPKIRHMIEADLINLQVFSSKRTAQKFGTCFVEFLHLNEKIGILQIFSMRANNLAQEQLIGKIDPFAVIKFQDKQYITEVKQQGGSNVIWTKKFNIPINNIQSKLQLTIYDKDVVKNDLIGSVIIDLIKNNILYPEINLKQSIVIKNKGEKTGIVEIESRFILNQF